MLLGAGCVALAVAVLWLVVWQGSLRTAFGITLMVLGALLALTGSNLLSRAGSADERAFLGLGPESEDPYSGAGLAPLGVFLFVSLPLFVVGGLLYGAG